MISHFYYALNRLQTKLNLLTEDNSALEMKTKNVERKGNKFKMLTHFSFGTQSVPKYINYVQNQIGLANWNMVVTSPTELISCVFFLVSIEFIRNSLIFLFLLKFLPLWTHSKIHCTCKRIFFSSFQSTLSEIWNSHSDILNYLETETCGNSLFGRSTINLVFAMIKYLFTFNQKIETQYFHVCSHETQRIHIRKNLLRVMCTQEWDTTFHQHGNKNK